MTINAEFEQTTTPQDPIVGPVDPSVTPNPDENKNWTVTFAADAAKGTIGAENTFYVPKTAGKTLADLAKDAPEVTAKAGFRFTGWNPALDKNTAINGNMTINAEFEQTTTPQDPIVGPVDPEDPNGGKPQDTSKYWTVTFESADETKGTVDAKNTVYVLKTENKTLADITAPEKTAKAGYEFDKWEPALDNATAITGDLTVKAYFKATGTPTPQNPPVVGPVDPEDPNGGKPQDTSKYWTVTFESADETKGTVDAKNTVYVLKTENKTLADITAPEKTAKAGYEFDKWEPALDNATAITGDLTVKAYFKATGTNPPTPPTPPAPTPNPSLDDKIDDSNKKPVYPIDKDQGTGVIVKDPDDIVVGGKDEDGKNIPTVIDPNTGEIIVNPGNNVDGPIVITVVDTKTGEQKDIVIDVIGHSSGRDDNRYYDYNDWYAPLRRDHSSSSDTTKVNTSVNTNVTKKVSRLEVRLVIGSKELRKSVDGIEERTMMDIAPFIEKDRTMLPIRFVAEALGFNVKWDNENRTVILIDKENVVKIPVDTNKIIVNGKVYESDVKPVIRNDRTMLPIANIARALGLKDGKDIFWNGNTREVLITREVSK